MTTIKNDVLNFLGIRANPFSVCSNQHAFFPHPSHKNACNDITDGIRQRAGLMLLTGMAGIGKTSVISRVAKGLDTAVHRVFLRYGNFRFLELVDYICNELEVIPQNKENQFDALASFLLSQYHNDRNVVLFLDDFNWLDYDIVAKLKALSIIPGTNKHVLQTLLVGLPLIEELLSNNGDESIALRCQLTPFSEHEIGPYIQYHLDAAGFEGKNPFKFEAIQQIGPLSRGIPGKINLLCNTAIMIANFEDRKVISNDVIERAAKQALLSSSHDNDCSGEAIDKADDVFGLSTVSSFIRASCKDVGEIIVNESTNTEKAIEINEKDIETNGTTKWDQKGLQAGRKFIESTGAGAVNFVSKRVRAAAVIISIAIISAFLYHQIDHGDREVSAAEGRLSDQSIVDAVIGGDLDTVASMVRSGATINETDEEGNSALLLSVEFKNTESTGFSVSTSANVNLQNNYEDTALMSASWNGQTKIVKQILEQPVDVNKKNERGRTALINASANGHLGVVEALSAARADTNAIDENGNSSLLLAAANGHRHVIEKLLNENVDINHQNKEGWTALMYAAWGGYTEIVRLLLNSGASSLIENQDFISASKLASVQGHWEIVTLLNSAEFNQGLQPKEMHLEG